MADQDQQHIRALCTISRMMATNTWFGHPPLFRPTGGNAVIHFEVLRWAFVNTQYRGFILNAPAVPPPPRRRRRRRITREERVQPRPGRLTARERNRVLEVPLPPRPAFLPLAPNPLPPAVEPLQAAGRQQNAPPAPPQFPPQALPIRPAPAPFAPPAFRPRPMGAPPSPAAVFPRGEVELAFRPNQRPILGDDLIDRTNARVAEAREAFEQRRREQGPAPGQGGFSFRTLLGDAARQRERRDLRVERWLGEDVHGDGAEDCQGAEEEEENQGGEGAAGDDGREGAVNEQSDGVEMEGTEEKRAWDGNGKGKGRAT